MLLFRNQIKMYWRCQQQFMPLDANQSTASIARSHFVKMIIIVVVVVVVYSLTVCGFVGKLIL